MASSSCLASDGAPSTLQSLEAARISNSFGRGVDNAYVVKDSFKNDSAPQEEIQKAKIDDSMTYLSEAVRNDGPLKKSDGGAFRTGLEPLGLTMAQISRSKLPKRGLDSMLFHAMDSAQVCLLGDVMDDTALPKQRLPWGRQGTHRLLISPTGKRFDPGRSSCNLWAMQT